MKTIIKAARTKATARPGLGDYVERLAKPIARALKLPCLDADQQLKPESPCARRRDRLNRLGNQLGIGTP